MLPGNQLMEHGLPENDLLEAVEVTMTRVLTKALRMNVSVVMGSQPHITAYPDNGEPIHIPVDAIERKLRRHLRHQVELELQSRRTLLESKRLKSLRGSVAYGEISRIADDGALLVSLEIADCYRRLILAGECPLRYQAPHERGRYRIGEVRQFFISSVLPVMINGRSSKVRILLSRISMALPPLLLQEQSHIAGIHCRKRIPGGYSDIVTPSRIPKEVIINVGKELGEYLHVSIQPKDRQ